MELNFKYNTAEHNDIKRLLSVKDIVVSPYFALVLHGEPIPAWHIKKIKAMKNLFNTGSTYEIGQALIKLAGLYPSNKIKTFFTGADFNGLIETARFRIYRMSLLFLELLYIFYK